MKIRIKNGLPYVKVSLSHERREMTFENVLLDTGSAGTVFSADSLSDIGLKLEVNDSLHRIRGVGGTEFVFSKSVSCLSAGELRVRDFEIEIGAMDYGFEIEGILGINFLLGVGACIDLAELEIYNCVRETYNASFNKIQAE